MTLTIAGGVVGQSLDFHSLYYLDSICAKNKINIFRELQTVVLVELFLWEKAHSQHKRSRARTYGVVAAWCTLSACLSLCDVVTLET